MAGCGQTRAEAYRWGMLSWFNRLLREEGVITEAEYRQLRQRIERETGAAARKERVAGL